MEILNEDFASVTIQWGEDDYVEVCAHAFPDMILIRWNHQDEFQEVNKEDWLAAMEEGSRTFTYDAEQAVLRAT